MIASLLPSRRRMPGQRRLGMLCSWLESVGQTTDRKLWSAMYKITKDEGTMDFFIKTRPERRMGIILDFVGVDN